MKYLLDTNVFGELFRGNTRVRTAMSLAGLPNCAVSEISLAELLYGARKSGVERHYHEIEFVKNSFVTLPIGSGISEFAKLKADLESKGCRIDNFDLLIAATAIVSNMTLVTHNTRHFERIPGLTVIDWQQ